MKKYTLFPNSANISIPPTVKMCNMKLHKRLNFVIYVHLKYCVFMKMHKMRIHILILLNFIIEIT